jgi:hypothetical protein
MSAPSKIAQLIAAKVGLPKLTDAKLDMLIHWIETGEQKDEVSGADLYAALIELKLNRVLK